MQISATASAFITGGISVLSFLGALSPKLFPSYVPNVEAQDIITTSGLHARIITAAVTPLHLFSSSDPGPLAPADSPRVQAAIAADKRSF